MAAPMPGRPAPHYHAGASHPVWGQRAAAARIGVSASLWQAGTVAGFDRLVTEALTAPFSGWDFTWLDHRSWTEPLPWDYSARVAALARSARTMLDMGTGGGEALSVLPDRAPRTVAIEAWPPNAPVAARRLLPLGIPVIQNEAATDNMNQDGANDGGRLPFRDGSLDLVCNRHESFLALEVSRVLAPGGTFVTQQVDYHDNDEMAQLLGIQTPEEPDSWIGLAERQVTEAGLTLEEAVRADQRIRFDDIAAIVFYLKAVSWSIPEYSFDRYRDRLRALYEDASAWPVMTSGHRFLLVACKPG
jgi:SAM-dependent methyltransferase